MKPKLRRPEFHAMGPDLYKLIRQKANTRKKMLAEEGRHISWVMPDWYDRRELPSQDYIPVEKNLATKIGMNKGEKVLVFAGYLGDWAGGLSHETRLTYTDLNHTFKEFVRKQKRASISKFKVIAGESVPQRPKIYDWSFSFEPIPLVNSGTMSVSLARSLLNNKGAKIIFSPMYEVESAECWSKYVKNLSKIYGVEVDYSRIPLNSQRARSYFGISSPSIRKFDLMTIHTNPIARKKAFLDLRLLNVVDKANFYASGISTIQLAKRFRVTHREVMESVKRLELLLGQKS
ncbi:MAG TPA: hypothetical protein PKK60_02030 [archaeon]|nr:hypothetical protein [archaeon]